MKSLSEVTHPEMVAILCKPGEQIVKEMTEEDKDLLLLSSRLMVVAAQLFDTVKKKVIYRKELNVEGVFNSLAKIDSITCDLQLNLNGADGGRDIPLTPEQAHLWHMISCVAGEGGELLDGFLQHLIEGEPLNLTNVVEELGDLSFYEEGIRAPLNLSQAVVLAANKHKLSKRYVTGYSDKAAQERADKAPESVSSTVKIDGDGRVSCEESKPSLSHIFQSDAGAKEYCVKCGQAYEVATEFCPARPF